MVRVYATAAEYETATGQPPPEGADRLLADASRMLDARVLRYCRYAVDTSGLPTHPTVAAALRDAVCAQVAWWDEIGDSTGVTAVGWGNVGIGSVQLGRSVTATGADASPARQLAPGVGDALLSPDLTPDIWQAGAVFW